MDNRRTPNQSNLHSKFARPRSTRRQDVNSTILSGSSHNVSIMGSSRNPNQTMRHNLNVTISGSFNPTAPASDIELEYDLAYNEYLQALMKQQIVKKTLAEQNEVLNDQIQIQSEQLHKLKCTREDIMQKIENLHHQSEIVEILDVLKNGIHDIESLCEKYNVNSLLHQLCDILLNESNLISVRNIKPLCSQKEYDELSSTLKDLLVILEKFNNSGRNFIEVNHLAKQMLKFNELISKIENTSKQVGGLNKKSATNFIKQGSDMFAAQGGYF